MVHAEQKFANSISPSLKPIPLVRQPSEAKAPLRREIPILEANDTQDGAFKDDIDETDSDDGDGADELTSAKKRLNLYMSSTIHSKRVSKILSSRPMDFLGLKFRLERG